MDKDNYKNVNKMIHDYINIKYEEPTKIPILYSINPNRSNVPIKLLKTHNKIITDNDIDTILNTDVSNLKKYDYEMFKPNVVYIDNLYTFR